MSDKTNVLDTGRAVLSQEDKKKIENLKSAWNSFMAAGDVSSARLAHEAAEEIRAAYGYSGGEDGSGFIRTEGNKSAAESGLAPYLTEMYRNQAQARMDEIKNAYSASVEDIQSAKSQIGPAFDNARNALSAETEKEMRAFSERAAARGLNSGTSSQADIVRSIAHTGAMADISAAEASEISQLEAQMRKLSSDYKTAIAAAAAKGEFELAGALYNEAVRLSKAQADESDNEARAKEKEYDKLLNLAQIAAKYGDYSLLQSLGIDASRAGNAAGSKAVSVSPKPSSETPEQDSSSGEGGAFSADELFELMYENEPNEYIFLTMNRSEFGIPSSALESVWAEYHAWYNKKIASEQISEQDLEKDKKTKNGKASSSGGLGRWLGLVK